MNDFTFGDWKNTIVDYADTDSDNKFCEKIEEFAAYLLKEKEKGKIPLIIAGAGASAKNVMINVGDGKPKDLGTGLPCLSEMIWQLREYVMEVAEVSSAPNVKELASLFISINQDLENVGREWLGKVFALLEKSEDVEVKKLWNRYCNWFFFECIDTGEMAQTEKYGALNSDTSKASLEIAKLYDTLGAICLSANFDNYIDFALEERKGFRNGIPIFDRDLAEKYFKRNRRKNKPYEETPYNRCVLHANGDVFWLFCSGEKGEGYCPETGKKVPAFTNPNLNSCEDMYCKFCRSPLEVTMTMPGTYEKDYNTRAIITTIWKYISTRISAVITVGLSCNWDDVLLKFILQLINERHIPLLDINNLTDRAKGGQSNIIEKVVKESGLEACAYKADAFAGIERINQYVEARRGNIAKIVLEGDYKEQLKNALKDTKDIKRLSQVSQLGLKAYWLEASEENLRWNHSIQVADIATEMYKQLCENSWKKESAFEKVLIYAAGLLHDCGHLPFSHLLEDVFDELAWHLSGEVESFKHIHYAKRVIERICNTEGCRFEEIIHRYGVKKEEVIDCIDGRYGVSYIDALINSAIDADKIAYIFTDAEKTKKSLSLNRKDFQRELLANAYITQEGMIALDDQSAWQAMRLLDERKRMYEELYYNSKIRYLEACAKYIITTYFVQKYNAPDTLMNDCGNGDDLGEKHILMAIDDLYNMIDADHEYVAKDLSASVSEDVRKSIEQCIKLICISQKSELKPREITILFRMCEQLLGHKIDIDKLTGSGKEYDYSPYQDPILDALVDKLDYKQLSAVRKKILLNYPGTILIDIYSPTKYFSVPESRKARVRPDGTNCGQEMILIPSGDRNLWINQKHLAETGILDYSRKMPKENEKPVFHIYKIGSDTASFEHTISMLKRELESIESKKE